MKILVFGGGLGNQIFGYAFSLFLKAKFPNETVYGVYNKKKLSEHHGLEINKWFNVKLPKSFWLASCLVYLLYVIKKVTGYCRLLDLNQYEIQKDNALVYFAYHESKNYIPLDDNWLKFKVDESELENKNKWLLNEIRNSNSVFVHVRRGDYFSPMYKDRFSGCCTLDYYNKALNYIKERVDSPHFFIFSDDINWAKNNLKVNNPIFIDWNTGENSPLDLYLMSNCKYAIMANSTFSYWGARLGNPKLIVTYPERWINPPAKVGDLFPKDWIKL